MSCLVSLRLLLAVPLWLNVVRLWCRVVSYVGRLDMANLFVVGNLLCCRMRTVTLLVVTRILMLERMPLLTRRRLPGVTRQLLWTSLSRLLLRCPEYPWLIDMQMGMLI